MSHALNTDFADSQGVQSPRSRLNDSHTNGSDPNAGPEKMPPHNGEYMRVLEKHLGVVESELSRLKGPQVNEPVMIEVSTNDHELKASETDMQAQEARVYRVPPWAWREVKNQLGINPKLPTLIASSKGHGRVGPRSVRRSTSGVGNLYQSEEHSLDIAYRLAINSRILFNLLGDCTGMVFPEDRNVWLRPFKYLVAYETEIREALQEAEETFDKVNAGARLSEKVDTINQDEASLQSAQPAQGSGEANVGVVEHMPHISTIDISRAKAERDQLRCLVDFMSSDMQDIFDVKRQVANQVLEEVAFEHLWLLYKPGDLVYTITTPEERNTSQAYRVLHVTGGRPILDTLNSCRFNSIEDRSWEDESETEEKVRDSIRGSPSNKTPFIIDCFFIDYDGNRVGPTSRRFVISTFNGKRKVDTLEPRPSFSFPRHENLQREMVQRGRRFTQLAKSTHQKYSGTTLRESRELWESMYYYNYIIHDEEIHSEVMVDQSAAVTHFRKALEKWRLKIGGRVIGVPTTADRRETFDPLPTRRDKDLLSDVFDDSIIDLDRRHDFVDSTMLLKYHRNILDPSLSDDYVMLLPFRVYGYAMLNRKYFPLNINLVNDITPDQVQTTAAGYEDLILPEGHKKLLQAIVKNQVRDPRQLCSGRDEDPDDFQMDVVKGKGKGLIILLHGAPGVGKTSTAECVAAQLKRPLLPITCGDVSTDVQKAEETLREYCALAYRWRCVLLLDEADVFLAKREKGDITRNGLVSVFLRVLEYFSGVIILTTNRVGEFDEAFRSRIHVSLYYPKLNRDTTMQIWERSLLRLRRPGSWLDFSEDEIRNFAEQHWLSNESRPSRQWNGRQIKNAFQTALALANWEFYEMKHGQKLEKPVLKAKHFDRVARTSDHFDDYISDIHNIPEDTYSILAARDFIRKDTHPAMSLGRSTPQDFVPRSKRTAPTRRGAGIRGSRLDEDSRVEGSRNNARVRQLEIELEIMTLKQASGKEEVRAQAGNKDDEDEEEW